MRSIEMGVHASAGLQFEFIGNGIERPNPGKGCIKMINERLRTPLQALLQGYFLLESNADIAAESCYAQAFLKCFSLFEHRYASS